MNSEESFRILIADSHLVVRSGIEIGTAVQITEGTVKSHVNNILSKLNVSDRTQAVIVALKRGLISLP